MITLSDVEDYVQSDISFSLSSDLSQKSQLCAAVTVNNDDEFEGDEDFSVCLSDIAPANCIIVEGGESLNVIIEDDEGTVFYALTSQANMHVKYIHAWRSHVG